ncbi:glycine zipper 2TM domain-containing protein [Ramlibacter sp. H39-3-26]|uniref:glycine zipper 2TM domain-containing protein n=1 Tax=Curvibacter soli TaxID=3031331 RepID=UPI0023DCD183|nr:glycine zipper 2TM domain-containing protein [Ramlibacter sp. H39-3-26]MDF1484384.1 glycine zipper 2TM domain-containing protein [Ramlibacter sp. H39-3-26]
MPAVSHAGMRGFAERLRHSPLLIPLLGILGIAVVALAAALVLSHVRPAGEAAAMAQAAVEPEAVLDVPDGAAVVTAPPGVGATRPAVRTSPPAQVGTAAAARAAAPPAATVAAAAPMPAAAPLCSICGTVESVTPEQRAVPTSGVGAVAGGVAGGLLGNQFGGGGGRTAMTVLGAVGGGFAGNAVERNIKRQTVYVTRVRMQDGTLRTFERAGAFAVGTPVLVEGPRIRVAPEPAQR